VPLSFFVSSFSIDQTHAKILLDSLVALGLLKKRRGRYQNTRAASTFLVEGKPLYQGDILGHYDMLWKRWSDLDAVLRTGTPVSKHFDHRSFIMGMHNIAVIKAPKVIAAINLKGVRKVLDLGGGPGTYSIAFAQKGLEVTLFDVEETVDIAREVAASTTFKGVIDFLSGDFTTDDIGHGYDLVFISQILHAFSTEDNIDLLQKAGKALSEKGKIVIQEFLINDEHTQPLQGALFAVNMLVNTEGGRTYSPSEIAKMLRKAHFGSVRKTVLEETVILQAQKTF
jgi:2-polyprenyl-3-methyl-5-hydroxy-6-metoxy-1,4-benzoquinol methylase